MNKKEFSLSVGGKTMTAEFNDLADQTNGSVIMRYGETVVLVTACLGKNEKDGDFFPLTVDFEERFYASGKILGNKYQRREGKPSDEAILSGRIIDRTIRPLFDQYIRRDVQVVATTLSIGEDDPDVLGLIGSSLALATSDIPWNGPVSGVRLAAFKNADGFTVNPVFGYSENQDYLMEMFACGKDGNINMIEVGAKEISEDFAEKALAKAKEEIEKIQTWQKQIVAEIGKTKVVISKPELTEEVLSIFKENIEPKLYSAVFCEIAGKGAIHDLEDEWKEILKTKEVDGKMTKLALAYYQDKVDEVIHKGAIEDNKRADGRGFDDVRPLFAQAGGISNIIHGAGIFYRGGTHMLSMLTLGGPQDSMTVEGAEETSTKHFIHHYNFPPYSGGETGRMGGTNRRMIGHGALAEKALKAVVPEKPGFPYTIRLVAESMASNGSTSMAAVCAGCLALMDGGVPIKSPVAGIASGLMMKDENNYKVLTDIQGPEDEFGDMDFKVAGTKEGITAIQMDIKVDGIPLSVLSIALQKAKDARFKILDVMTTAISAPRENISANAPKIVTLVINKELIGLVIGPQGKMIKEITEKTGAEINIEQDGTVYITGKNGSADAARELIYNLTREYKAGEVFSGTVTRLMDFGAFVQFAPNMEGLVHVSEIAPFRVQRVSDVLREGMQVPVIIKEIDEKKRINLSIKGVDSSFIKNPYDSGIKNGEQPKQE
ncbi:MAG: polyribonucleotide nucleotidyltransferase [bacterium]